MQSYYTYLALEIANDRSREAELYRLANRGRQSRPSWLGRLLRELAGNVGAAFSQDADKPAERPA